MLVDEDDDDYDDSDESFPTILLIGVDNLIGFLSKSFKEALPINPLTVVSMDEITDMWDFEFGIKNNQYQVTPWDLSLFVEKIDKLRCERLEKAS
jgi:hypothetical protein